MSNILIDIDKIGRFWNTQTGQEYNVWKGTNKVHGTDHYFYYHRSSRIYIPAINVQNEHIHVQIDE